MTYKAPELSDEQKEWLDVKLQGFANLVYVGFHGSHLYGLDREGSDIDVKAIYLPTMDELIEGSALKTHNYKNDDLDIEIEIKSLSSFIRSCKTADTNCVDLLHSPDEMAIFSSEMWENLVKERTSLYAKNMKGIIGYIKVHTHKYTSKLDRLAEMRALLDTTNAILVSDKKATVKTVAESSEVTDASFKYIDSITLVKDGEQQYLEVCGKKYIYTWSAEDLRLKLLFEIARYGKRSKSGLEHGLDTKSLSHALRVLLQLREIIKERSLTFPLRDAGFVKAVKLGEITDVNLVMAKIDMLYEECMQLIEESDLKEDIDITPMFSFIKKYYLGK